MIVSETTRVLLVCIIQSIVNKCVFAPVSPREPLVLSHSAQEAPYAEPPPKAFSALLDN